MISTPYVPVPPPRYGGTELVVGALVEGLAERGHEVTLFSCGGSRVGHSRAELRTLYDCAAWPPDPRIELDHAGWAIESVLGDARGFDLIHAHVPAALAFAPLCDVPMAYTVHHEREPALQPSYRRLARHARFIAISARQRKVAALDGAHVIHHGVPPDGFPLGDGAGGYAAFLGRFAAEKGVHHAIDAARAARVELRLAGRPHPGDGGYYRGEVVPRLACARAAHELGEVGGRDKAQLLGDAIALLFPIEWEEPFGLVMIESMLCGTPVLAFERGSVPEVIDDGVTGFLCATAGEMAWRLRRLARDGFDRRRCRERALERWSAARMVDDHIALYQSMTSKAVHVAGAPASAGA